jgi:hypothetical protein
MFEGAPPTGTETLLPSEAELMFGGGQVTIAGVSTDDFVDVGPADADELRRLEDSIRWLTNEGSVRHIPGAATLAPVRGLSPVDSHDDDSLLLNPDALFAPRSLRRRGGVARSAAKILLVSAVAAPAAYFIANWTQFPGTVAPSNSPAVSSSATLPDSFEERIALVASVPGRLPPEAAQIGDDISGTPQPEATVVRGAPPVEATADIAAETGAAGPKRAPEQALSVSATPSDLPTPAAGSPSGPSIAESSSPPLPADAPPKPVAAPLKPVMSAGEVALMLERGRVLFEAGDLAAARRFFRRAANAGDASAALAMGATYDPDVLAKRFIRGIEADAQEARMWYERARELGSPEGPRRIEMLAHR